MGYRYQIILDDECKKMLDAIPEKKRSAFVRNRLKAAAIGDKQKEMDDEKAKATQVAAQTPTYRVKL